MLTTVLVDGLCPFSALKICYYEFLARSTFRPVQIENVEILPRAEKGYN